MLAGKQKHIMKAPTIEETELAKEAASGESLVQHQYEVVFQQPNADKLRPSMSIVVRIIVARFPMYLTLIIVTR